MTDYTIGTDISKTHLDAFRLEDQTAKRFDTAPRGFQALIKWLGATPVARVDPPSRQDRITGPLRQRSRANSRRSGSIHCRRVAARKPVGPASGLGPIAAALILTFRPEIGPLDRKQSGSLAGLVPNSRESGQWKGKSFISGGRKPLRDALYMPALVAMRFNPDLKAECNALREAGKPAKVACIGKAVSQTVF